MREIKFRAWGPQSKYMIDASIIEKWQIEELMDGTYIPMQFTGLKDKNGTDIYEGDIYKTYAGETPNGNAKEAIYKVIFNHGAFVLYDHHKQGDRYLGSKVNMCNGEVIGNIYENPNLIDNGTKVSPQT